MKLPYSLAFLLLSAVGSLASDLSAAVLSEMNLARTAPQQYAQLVASRLAGYRGKEGPRVVEEAVRFLAKAKPLPALTFSEGLSNAALSHVLTQGAAGGTGHGNPWTRMARFGSYNGYAAENIHYGKRDARGIVMALIVDDGVRGRKHRANIFSRNFRVAGVGCGPHASFGAMCVVDFASSFTERGGRVAGL